ncbi:hypothetical protein BDZ89DRAFT_1066050 [Hymenopellis radicata]|nr:hypothetical protein BDZ89DRAFT_1066050 [Hymenopellis radicata]
MPSHRHATPSGPWPFLDVNDPIDPAQLRAAPEPRRQTHESEMEYPFNNDADDWHKYPQSLFMNWSLEQQQKSGVATLLRSSRQGYRSRYGTKIMARPECAVYRLLMQKNGRFHPDSSRHPTWRVSNTNEDELWTALIKPADKSTRCQMFFIDSLSGPVLQMLGTRFTIDPFFFSSSLSWIPSRYSEQLTPGRSDHITMTLTYINMRPWLDSTSQGDLIIDFDAVPKYLHDQMIIDTHAPLVLQSCNRIIVHDLLGIHAVRHGPDHHNPSTIITYVPPTRDPKSDASTSASTLNTRVLATGRSVHWSDLYRTTADPTLLVLAQLWYPLYSWDETLEVITAEVIWLEAHTLSTNDMDFGEEDAHTQTYLHTHQLHVLRAHLLHYAELIRDFRKTVEFLRDTPHPVMESHAVFKRECTSLLNDIERLEETRAMLDGRVGNAMDLAFSSVTNEDSKRMQALSEASLRDSAAMKQIAYITMVYLPASFSAAIFGMNTVELNDSRPKLYLYFAIAVPLTLLTVWVMTLLYRGEKKRREIEDPTDLAKVKFFIFQRLFYPITVFFHSLSFTPRFPRQRKMEREREWEGTRSAYASARSSMRSARPQRGGTSLRTTFVDPASGLPNEGDVGNAESSTSTEAG